MLRAQTYILCEQLSPPPLDRAVADVPDARVELHTEALEQGARINVVDNGPGIPEAQREEVFRPFYRLDASRNLETGSVGLGLSIARDVIRNHGGQIRLGDSPQGGLRVHIRLPQ